MEKLPKIEFVLRFIAVILFILPAVVAYIATFGVALVFFSAKLAWNNAK